MTRNIRYIHPSATGHNSVFCQMFDNQQGRCFICERTFPESWEGTREEWDEYVKERHQQYLETNVKAANAVSRWLVQDHDHETGIVRALVCPSCNGALAGIDRFVRIGKLQFVLNEYLRLGHL